MATSTNLELAKTQMLSTKSPVTGALLGFFFGPFGYIYTGNWMMFGISLITGNFLMLGIVMVPYMLYTEIKKAQEQMGVAA